MKKGIEIEKKKTVPVLPALLLSFVMAASCFAVPDGESGKAGVAPPAAEAEAGAAKSGAIKINVAKVNGVAITKDSLINVMTFMLAKQESGRKPEDLKKDALNSLIVQELAYQKAKAVGLAADKKKVDDALEKMKEKLEGEEGYREFLERESLTEEGVRSVLERKFTLEKIFEKEVAGKVVIQQDEVKKEYEKEKEKYRKPENISVIDVVFFLKLDDPDSVRKTEAILKEIRSNAEKDPRDLVADGTFLVRTVDLLKDEEPELYAEAKKLTEGELSGVIRTSDSLHILKLKSYIPEKQLTYDEVGRSIEMRLRTEAQKKRMQEFEAELKKGAKIEIIDMKGSE
ncbi:MAG: peptidyl-prolyl cis-trans isomerase [Thermodesulfovibrionales bacterium]